MRIVVLAFFSLLVVSAPAWAQTEADDGDHPRAFQGQDDTEYPEYPDAPADAPIARLRMVFDLVSHDQELGIDPLVPFDVYVVAHDVQVALRGWEATIVIDERLKVLEKEIVSDINVGSGMEVRSALKPQHCESGSTIQLARLRLMLTEPANDLVLGLAPISEPSLPSVETELELPTPVYLVCRPGADIRPFDYCRTCAVVNPVSVHPETDGTEDGNSLKGLLETRRGRRG